MHPWIWISVTFMQSVILPFFNWIGHIYINMEMMLHICCWRDNILTKINLWNHFFCISIRYYCWTLIYLLSSEMINRQLYFFMYYYVHLYLKALYDEVTKILIMVTCCYKFKVNHFLVVASKAGCVNISEVSH